LDLAGITQNVGDTFDNLSVPGRMELPHGVRPFLIGMLLAS